MVISYAAVAVNVPSALSVPLKAAGAVVTVNVPSALFVTAQVEKSESVDAGVNVFVRTLLRRSPAATTPTAMRSASALVAAL